MFPPYVLILFHLVLFLLRFPLGKLPLSFFALEKSMYLREQDTGRGLRPVTGDPGAVGLPFPRHRALPGLGADRVGGGLPACPIPRRRHGPGPDAGSLAVILRKKVVHPLAACYNVPER